MYAKTLLITSLAAAAAAAQHTTPEPQATNAAIDPSYLSALAQPYLIIPGVPELLGLYSKYATESGFNAFGIGLASKIQAYGATAHIDTAAFPTETPTNTAEQVSVIATNVAVQSVIKEVVAQVTSYVATETYLPKSVKSELAGDVASVARIMTGGEFVIPTVTGTGTETETSGVPMQTGNAANSNGVKIGAMVVGAVAAGAALL